jgi:hypothetical protein
MYIYYYNYQYYLSSTNINGEKKLHIRKELWWNLHCYDVESTWEIQSKTMINMNIQIRYFIVSSPEEDHREVLPN